MPSYWCPRLGRTAIPFRRQPPPRCTAPRQSQCWTKYCRSRRCHVKRDGSATGASVPSYLFAPVCSVVAVHAVRKVVQVAVAVTVSPTSIRPSSTVQCQDRCCVVTRDSVQQSTVISRTPSALVDTPRSLVLPMMELNFCGST